MLKPPNQSKKDAQLNALLRFKQEERPDAAFWSRFDQELHQRMLHALVKKDPLHRQIMRGLTGKLFPTATMAAAALALALVVVPSEENIKSTHLPATRTVHNEVSDPVVAAGHSVRADHRVEVINYEVASIGVGNSEFRNDFGMDRVEIAEVDQADYSVQDVAFRARGNTALASLSF